MSNDGHDTSDDISWFGVPMISPVILTFPTNRQTMLSLFSSGHLTKPPKVTVGT